MHCATLATKLGIAQISSTFWRSSLVRMASLSLALVLFCCFCATFSMGQVAASLSGIVTDSSGAVVSGAAVEVKSLDTGVARTADTDASGRCRFFALPVGLYEMRVT